MHILWDTHMNIYGVHTPYALIYISKLITSTQGYINHHSMDPISTTNPASPPFQKLSFS